MAENALNNLVLRSASVVSLNDRFSQVLEAPALGKVKREPHVEDVCCEVDNPSVVLRKIVTGHQDRVRPGVQRGPRPQRVSPDSTPSGQPLSSGTPEGQFLGGRCCPCALWGLRLLRQRYGPLKRTGFTPNKTRKLYPFGRRPGFRQRWPGGMSNTGTSSTTLSLAQTNTWQHAPKQGWKPEFKRKVEVPTKEQLDQQLDDYMSRSKRCLDRQLDAYMAMADDVDEEWCDIDGVQ